MKIAFLFLCLVTTVCHGQNGAGNPDEVYTKFAESYDDLNAASLADLYTENAEALNLYDDVKPNSLKGREDIKQYYKAFFERMKSNNQKVGITFKVESRKKAGDNFLDNGFYQLKYLTPDKPAFFSFGKFSTVLELENGSWKFKTDATTNAEFIEYENTTSRTIPPRDEELYAPFYDQLLGDYIGDDNEVIVIGRSPYRLFAYFENTGEYKGLNKVDATTWAGGETIISNQGKLTFKFQSNNLEIFENEALVIQASKQKLYSTEEVSYSNSKKVQLAGTLFIPIKPNGKAIVLVHGSGPQDRNGYASVIRLLADVLSREGITVLTYDKQGVGQSEGDWRKLNFAELSIDAIAGIDFLQSRKDLNLTKVGIGGSSQAGWIIAKAIQQKEDIDFVLTIGAAGSGVSVIEQNLYNTQMRLNCDTDFSQSQIAKILKQQAYFFDFLTDQKNASQLDKFTEEIARDTAIADWLFPKSDQVDLANRDQWFTVLEVNFNPLEAWESYNKPVLMIFSEFDDSTPTRTVIANLEGLKKSNIKTIIIPEAQHIGIITNSICKGSLSELNKFQPEFFYQMKSWLSHIE